MTSANVSAQTFSQISMMTGVRLGFVTAGRRLLSRSTFLVVTLAFALALVGGIIERKVTTWGAVDRSLVSTFRLVIPLYCFAIASAACHRQSLREAAWPVARFGAARKDVALGIILALVIASVLGGVLFAAVAVVSAHNVSSRPLLRELFTSAWIGGLVAAAYGGWFALGSTFGSRGRGRWFPLVGDFLFGGGAGVLAAVFPRAHARGLLGVGGPMSFSQPENCMALIAMMLVFALLAVFRSRD